MPAFVATSSLQGRIRSAVLPFGLNVARSFVTNLFPRPVRAIDILLADVVRKIQLSPTNYDLAVSRYRTIAEWLERDGSPLKGLVTRLYPQGSMAMRATISSRLENDEFDIDIMAEMEAALYRWGPRVILDVLFDAINGEPGSRYYGKVQRNTRCVTIAYDDMHLDVTPAVLMTGEARTSRICHSKLELPAAMDHYVTANPWGFAKWFGTATSPVFRTELLAKDAEAEPVPERPEWHERSLALMSLQLLKRWRNKRYDQRSGRWPPSILLAQLVGEQEEMFRGSGAVRTSLHGTLTAHANAMFGLFEAHHAEGSLIQRTNPRCSEDVVTDRWPGSMTDQDRFRQDLRELTVQLHRLDLETRLDEKRAVLADLFGERVTKLAFDDYQARLDEEARTSGLRYSPVTGAIRSGLAVAGIGGGVPAPRHTSFGGPRVARPWRS